MVDELIGVVAEVTGDIALAVGGSAAKEEKERRKKKHGWKLPVFILILVIGLTCFQLWRFGMIEEFGLIIDEVGYFETVKLVGGILGMILIFGLSFLYKYRREKANKPLKRIYFLLVTSGILTSIMIYLTYTDLDFSKPLQFIPFIAFIFGIILMFILLFDRMREGKINKIPHIFSSFIMRLTIPMMPVCIIFLGAMSSLYQYPSIFLEEVRKGIGINGKHIGGIIGDAFYGVVEDIFNLGVARPKFWIGLSLATFIILLYFAIRKAFFSEEWPYNYKDIDEEKEAQYFIDQSADKYLSNEDLECFNRGKLRLNKTVLDKLEKAEDKEWKK